MTVKFHRVALLALPLVIAAIAAPGASATDFPTARQIAMHEGKLGAPVTAATVQFPTARQVALHQGALSVPASASAEGPVASSPGFSWGDAGIGAGTALVLITAVIGGALILNNRRHRAVRQASTT